MEPLTWGAILAMVVPLLIKEVLPHLLKGIVGRIFAPATPEERANAKRDEAIIKGDLVELGRINELIIDKSGVNALTDNELNNMLKLVS